MSSRPYVARPNALYRLALVAVAVAMALLPLCYAALIVLVAYAIFAYVEHGFLPLLSSQSSPLFGIILAFTPFVIGWVLLLSLLRPLFTRRAVPPLQTVLPPGEQGILLLIRQVCTELGAHFPRQIELSCELNASAGLARGWRGFFGGRVILTLGLPLVASLTQRELAGVIAHELGHFRQRTGMRASFLIRTISLWFARVVYTRGSFDPTLGELGEGLRGVHPVAVVFLVCSQIGSAVGRGVLWLLMMSGHLVCAALMRQMEYDADRCEAWIAGYETFETAFAKLNTMGLQFGQLEQQMSVTWRLQRRLPDDVPGLVASLALNPPVEPANPPPQASTLGRWLDTHPSVTARLNRVRAAMEPGSGINHEPARALFEDFEVLSRRVTLDYYENQLNLVVPKRGLIPFGEWLSQSHSMSSAIQQPPPLPPRRAT